MNKRNFTLWIMLLVSALLSAQDKTIESKVETLLSKMTLEEKVGQMNQYSGFLILPDPPRFLGLEKINTIM